MIPNPHDLTRSSADAAERDIAYARQAAPLPDLVAPHLQWFHDQVALFRATVPAQREEGR